MIGEVLSNALGPLGRQRGRELRDRALEPGTFAPQDVGRQPRTELSCGFDRDARTQLAAETLAAAMPITDRHGQLVAGVGDRNRVLVRSSIALVRRTSH